MLKLQNVVLEMIAKGEALEATTERLCREIEAFLPGVLCTVLRVERNGLLHALSAPSFPDELSSRFNGIMIGPAVGSCGSAAYLGIPIISTDIENDPRWADYKEAPLSLGLKACWSSPIHGTLGEVLGTFAFYFREKRGPNAREEELVAACTHLCALALERHKRVTERERRANVDALTDLPNRASFDVAIERLSSLEPGTWALLVIDVDNLKIVNDTFGHHAGDVLLQTIAARVSRAVAPDRVFRLGGDEFAVILQAPDALTQLERTARHILDAVAAPADCGGHVIIPRATIGGAQLSDSELDSGHVRQHADFALYHAKETNRGGFAFFRPEIRTSIIHRIETIRDVEAALRDDMIDAFYQPIVRLDTRTIVGMEALCRLKRPTGEIVSAAAFMDATADARIASQLTERMMSIVASDVRIWLDQGIPVPHVGLNISSADFHSGRLYGRLQAAFSRKNVPLGHVVVEVTESVYLGRNDPAVAREIRALRDNGLRVALDDFGTGFASLTNLLTVPVDIIKIDKTFVDNLTPGDPSSAIVDGLFGIATKLGIQVVAEGIEREDQAAQLTSFGYRLGQGYLFSPAVSRTIATGLLVNFAQQSGGREHAGSLGISTRPAQYVIGHQPLRKNS